MRILLILLLLCSTANAALTPNKVPKTKTGGTTPTLQDSTITDDGTNVTASGNITADNHIVSGFGTVPQVYSDVDTNSGLFFSGPDVLEIHTGGLNGLAINSAQNVGVATHSPSAKLHVYNTSAGNSFEVDDQASDTTPFIINSAGNVGIGTHTPTTKLSITPESGVGDGLVISRAGNGDTAGGYWRVALRNSANNDSMNLAQSSSNYTTGGPFAWVGNSEGFLYYPTTFKIGTGVAGSPAMYFNNNGNIGIGTLTNPTAKLAIESTADQDLFRVSDDGALDTSPFTITSTGNVGIGTINPVAGVEITEAAAINAFRVNDQASDTSPFIIDSTGNVGIGTSLTTTAALSVMSGNVGIGTWIPSELFEVGARKFQVQSDGDITLPGASILSNTSGVKLDFSPNASSAGGTTFFRLSSGTTSTASSGQSTIVAINPSIAQSGTAGYTALSVNVTESSAGSGTRELINVQNGSSRMMVLTADGNLGISTFQPNALLDISSTAAQDLFRVNDNGTGDTSPFIITSTGNVGIGSVTPSSILDIDKGTGVGQVTINGSTGGCLMIRDTDDAGWTECDVLDGVMTCSIDADGICD